MGNSAQRTKVACPRFTQLVELGFDPKHVSFFHIGQALVHILLPLSRHGKNHTPRKKKKSSACTDLEILETSSASQVREVGRLSSFLGLGFLLCKLKGLV